MLMTNLMYHYTKSVVAHDNFQLQYAQQLGEPLQNPQWSMLQERFNLESELQLDEFQVQVCMKTHQILWHKNLNALLGYDLKPHLPESFFDNIIHPFILPYYNAFAFGMFEWLREAPNGIISEKFRYKITVPVRKASGEYLNMLQIASPCQCDAQGQVVTYCMRFIYCGSYVGQPLQPVMMSHTTHLQDCMARWHQLTAAHLPIDDKQLRFTRDELKVLKEAYQVRLEVQRNKLLKEKLHLSIKHLNASIKFKMKELFIQPLDSIPKPNPLSNFYTCLPKFNDVYQIAEFLHHSGLLEIMECQLRLP